MGRVIEELTEADMAAIIDAAVRGRLAPFGHLGVTVRAGEDHDGEPALFATAHRASGAAPVDAAELTEAALEAQHALGERGEDRFLYLLPSVRPPSGPGGRARWP